MTTYELDHLLQDAASGLENQDLKEALKKIDDLSRSIVPKIGIVLTAPSADQGSAIANLRETVSTLRESLRMFGVGRPFRGIQALSHRSVDNPFLLEVSLNQLLNNFYESYEKYVSSYEYSAALELMMIAPRLLSAITATQDLVTSLQKALTGAEVIAEEGLKELSLFLTAPTSYRSLIVKLTAIQNLYNETCRMLDISESEHPLRIVKVESGSLWIKLFGESRVITFMISAIEAGVSFLHRNFITEGKLGEIPKKATIITSLMDLSERLSREGIDVNELNEAIGLSAIKLINELNELLRGEPTVEINGRRYSVGQQLEDRFLKEGRMLFIGTGEDDRDDGEKDSSGNKKSLDKSTD